MAHQSCSPLLDANLVMHNATVTADQAGTVGGVARVLDLGAQAPGFNGTAASAPAAYSRFGVRLAWTACETGDGDELFTVSVQGATDSAFTVPHDLGRRVLGALSSKGGLIDSPPSGAVMLWADNAAPVDSANGSACAALRYVRLYVEAAGTVDTGLALRADFVPA